MGDEMSIETQARAALAAIAAAHPSLAVSVRLGDQTGTGVRVLTRKSTVPNLMGQAGDTTAVVRVSSADFDEPTRGARVQVDDVQVYVTECRTSGGLRVIEYSETQPVEGV